MSTFSPQENIETGSRSRSPLRLALIRLVIDVAVVALAFFVAWGAPVWQATVLRVVVGIALLSTLASLFFIRRERPSLAVWLLVGGMLFEILVAAVFVQGLGLWLFAAAITMTAVLVIGTLPQGQMRLALGIGAGIGLIALLGDLFFGGASFRHPAPPQAQTFILIVLFVLAAYYAYVAARQFGSFPLRTKLIVSFMLVTLLSLALLGFLNERSTRALLTSEANEALFSSAAEVAGTVDTFISTNLSTVSSEAIIPVFVNYLTLTPAERIDSPVTLEAASTLRALSRREFILGLSYALLDSTGVDVLDTNSQNVGTDESNSDYFQTSFSERRPFASQVDFTPQAGLAQSLVFSAPILDANGQVYGVLRMRFSASILQEIIRASNNRAGAGSFGVLFAEVEGNFIHLAHGIAPETLYTAVAPFPAGVASELQAAGRLPTSTMMGTLELDLPELQQNLLAADETTYFSGPDFATGELTNQVAQVRLQQQPNWIMAYFQPQEVFLSAARQETQTTVLLGLLIAAAVFGLALALAQLIARPISDLTTVTERVLGGDLGARAMVTTNDEIGGLAATFNRMTAQLQTTLTGLEEQVADRTADLERQATHLRLAAETARDATAERDLEDLLDRAVTLIRTRFDFYHVGIYLLDEKREFAFLRAATEETGRRLVESKYRERVGSDTAVGYVTSFGEPRIVTGIGADSTATQQSLLPKTASKIVLPLRVGEEILGALDIHSTKENAFSQNDLTLFRTLADQLAIAIQNTAYRDEVERALRELETAYGEYTQEAWRKYAASSKRPLGYQFDQVEVEPVKEQGDLALRAWQARGSVVQSDDRGSKLAVPMMVRGAPVGVLNLQFEEQAVPGDAQALVEEVANRLGLVLENARLLEDSQRRAERERLVGEIAGRMRETMDIDRVLQNTLQEIAGKLGVRDVEVRMATDPNLMHPQSGSGADADGDSQSENGV